MKVVHICTSLSGGAGIAAKRIIESTQLFGIETRVLVAAGKRTTNTDVILNDLESSGRWFLRARRFLYRHGWWPKTARIQKRIQEELAHSTGNIFFSSPITDFKNLANHPWIAEADIIHLHWMGNYIDYPSFFKKVNKPFVWTIHDENPGLGGFHYTMWEKNGTSKLNVMETSFWKIKKKAYSHVKNMTLVAISSIMKEFFNSNKLLNRFPCVTIHNGVETDKFKSIPKETARKALDIKEGKRVFLFAAQDIWEDRKGLKELIDALIKMNDPNTLLICIGNYDMLPVVPFEVRCEGFVANPNLLSIYYSAADLFVMPSFQEAFAQTPIEAMACGTPVVAFPCSGSSDLILPFNGIVCKDFNADSLYIGIKTAMAKQYDSTEIRKYIVEKFDYKIIAKQYIKLYESILL